MHRISDAREADRRAEVEQRLRARRVELLTGPLLDAGDIDVDRQDILAEGKVPDGRGGVRADARKLRQIVWPAPFGDVACSAVQVDGTPVVAEPLPGDDHVRG